MKMLIIFCVLLLFAFAKPKIEVDPEVVAAWEKILKPHRDICMNQTGVSEEVARFPFKYMQHLSNNSCFKCYLKCLDIQLGIMDTSGNFNQDIIESSPARVDKTIVSTCLDLVRNETDLCNKVYNAVKCYLEKKTQLN